MVDNQDKITTAELQAWFGDTMPVEVINYIFDPAKQDRTMEEVRAWVRKYATNYKSTSQGKVERAREFLVHECECRGESLTASDIRDGTCKLLWPQIAIAAITQALTESSGQGTDGAEAVRDAVIEECAKHLENEACEICNHDDCRRLRESANILLALKLKQPSEAGDKNTTLRNGACGDCGRRNSK